MDPIMNTNSLDSRMNNTLSFMDAINKEEGLQKELDAFRNTPEAKIRKIEHEKECGKNHCLKHILGRVYGDSIPTSEPIPQEDLDRAVEKFARKRLEKMGRPCDDNECLFYVKEAIKRNPDSPLNNIYEAVSRYIDDMYIEKEMNINDVKPDDLGFNRTAEVDDKMDSIIRDNNLDSLSEVIKTNVKDSVAAEIDAAKREKEDRMDLENSLSLNPEVSSEDDIKAAVESVNMFNNKLIYQPSLFEGIMISKFNAVEKADVPMFEATEEIMTEGVISAIKDFFKTKAAADAKGTIVASSTNFNKWLDRNYREVYSAYRSIVLSINMDQLVKGYNEALTHSDVINAKQVIKVPDIERTEKYYNDVMAKNKENLDNYKNYGVQPESGFIAVNLSMADFVDEVKKANTKVHTAFDKPKLKEFIDKYGKMAVNKSNGAGTSKEVNATFNKVCYMACCELDILWMYISVINTFTGFAKNVIRHVSKQTLKESAYEEAVKEYTLYNVAKALRLESFSMNEVKDIANEYAAQ